MLPTAQRPAERTPPQQTRLPTQLPKQGRNRGPGWLRADPPRPQFSFDLYAECVTRNAGLGDSQAGIKMAGNISNLRYADSTILMAESEEELKSLLMRVTEESEKAGLELNIQKTKIIASSPNTSWQIE